MCGIAGIISERGGRQVTVDELKRARDVLRHRGPDDAGLWLAEDGLAGLVHRRLSIIDLSPRGHQPMQTADGRLRIVYNGEVYNHVALRRELEEAGHVFESASDTEVILHGYREWGAEVCQRLRGMYAFAIHDSARHETFLARDPLGIKPLYVAEAPGRLVFASEVRGIAAVAAPGDIDPEGLVTYLLWGSIASPRTLHSGVRALPPSGWLRVGEDGRRDEGVGYRLEEQFSASDPMEEQEGFERLRSALRDSVRQHLVADVPVGAFLSGGVDSSALVGLLSELHDGAVETVTLAFDVPQLDEGKLAAGAAQLYGTRHHEIRLGIDEVRDRMPDAIGALDQPTIDGINTYFVSEAAVRAGLKVAVSGVGGDELFGGYLSFQRLPRIARWHTNLGRLPGLAPMARSGAGALERLPLPRAAAKMVRALRHGDSLPGAYYADRGLFSPPEVKRLLHPDLHPVVDRCDPARWLAARIDLARIPEGDRVSALEIRQYLQSQLLRDADAASMAHSLEVRTPLVDRTLLATAAQVPTAFRLAGPAKRALREAPEPPVPRALWDRRKQGFTLPIDSWMRTGGIDLTLPRHSCLDPTGVEQVARRFSSGNLHYSRLWALLVLGRFLP